jgi:hypothetical protein
VQILNNLNLSKNEIQNARIQNLGTAPGSPVTGQVYFDTTLGYARIYNGTAWQRADASGAVTSVGATAPIQSSGGTTPTISIDAASTSAAGSMSAADKTLIDGATNVDTASTLVKRDSSKRFRAADPSDPQDVATKAYVDATASGLDVKQSVRVATTASITLSNTQTIDGVALSAGDRVLVKDQTSGGDNGIYVVASGAWSRSSDADSNSEVTPNLFVFVEEGGTYADSGWTLTNNGAITVGTTALTFTQFSGAGQITAGDGLTKSGNTLNVGGTADRITVNADTVDIAGTYAGQNTIATVGTIATGTWSATEIAVNKGGTGATDAATARTNLGAVGKYSSDIGNNSSTDITVTHNLSTRDVTVQVYETASPYAQVLPDVEATTTNTVTIKFATAPTTNQYRVVVTG